MHASTSTAALALLTHLVAAAGCTTTYAGRWFAWNWSGIGDHRLFPDRPVAAAPRAFHFVQADGARRLEIDVEQRGRSRRMDLNQLGRSTRTTALIVVRADTVLFEGYFNGYTRESINTSFSIAKSVTSLLVGAAIDVGIIRDVNDPVTDYLPELAHRDERFTRLTLAHLLDMRSGLRWRDHDFITGDKPRAYYHPHLRRVIREEVRFSGEPGERWVYNSYNTILLGMVLERAAGRTVAELLAEHLWTRIGAEFAASWSTDGTREPMEKMESGINARAIDFARLGRLILRRGDWDGEPVVSGGWMERSTRAEPGCELPGSTRRPVCYHRAWWLYPAPGGGMPAIAGTGHLGQYIHVVPELSLVIVRFGHGPGGVSWPEVFRSIARLVAEDGNV
jgi:CubicO group peptidase (beta-lactamase class C family)